jgi:LysR family transcriptional regulator, transcriptional activator of the cysJI operon
MADRRLQVFHAVVRLGSFTKAARALHMTQPAVTFQVRQLEEHFDTRLLDRKRHRIELTEAGRLVYEQAARILALYADLERSVHEVTGRLSGLVILGASTTVAEYVLPSVLVEFRHRHPEVVIRLLVSNTDGIIQKLIDNEIDLGLVEAPVQDRSLAVALYHMDELAVVMRPDHPLAGRERLRASDLLNQPFIAREEGSGTREVVASYLRSADLELDQLDVVMELASPEAIKAAVEAGLGLSILSLATLRKELALGTLAAVTLDPPIERPFSFVYRRQKFRTPVVETLLAFARRG